MASPECLICAETPGFNNLVRLSCEHYHCHACLTRQLDICNKTTPFQPARCCEDIPARLFPTTQHAAVREYRARLAELQSNNRLYCHVPACRAFIPRLLRAGRSAKCRECHAKTCSRCGAKAHFKACAEDPSRPRPQLSIADAEALLRELATRFGWKRCPDCHAMVSKVNGCNHIRCRCGCDFCYRCGRAPYGDHGECFM